VNILVIIMALILGKILLIKKQISPAIFILILICFFLPFVTVSCQNREIVKLTGVQIAVGENLIKPSLFIGDVEREKIPSQPLATSALVCSCVGLVTSLLKSRRNAIIPAIMGLIGAIFLWLLKLKIAQEALIKGEGFLKISYEFGFWLSLVLLAIAAIFHAWIFFFPLSNQRERFNK
ncbi:MAG: hypothetical protein SAJ37_15565, partial [Oscillatoria sp. PMC 1068.18]|nr:hypothetical protein [Oscillatoria sp. PMC 1068.18]